MVRSLNSFCLFFIILCRVSFAQPSGADLALLDKYKKSDFFYLLYSERVKISVEKKAILTTTHTNKIFCYNNYVNTGYSNFDIVYNSSFSEIKNLKAASYVPVNGKYKKIEVEDFSRSSYSESNVFEDSYREITFTLPAVRDGTIGQIEHDEINTEPHFSTTFYFKHFAPIGRSEYMVEADGNVEIAYKFIGDPAGIKFEKFTKGNSTFYKWTADNLDVVKREDYMPSLNKVSPGVVCWIKSAMVDNKKQVINEDLASFTKWIYGISKQIYSSSLSPEIKNYVDSLKQLKLTDLELGQKIFRHVQKNIKYIAFEDGMHGFVPRKPADVFYKKYGDCKDKATLLSAMLNYAGLEARTALVGTSSIAYKFSELPIPECANHMVTGVMHKGKWIITDATDEYDHYLSSPESLQGKEALVLIDSITSVIVTVPEEPSGKNGRLDSLDIRISGKEIAGKGKTYYFGYMKENVLEAIESVNADRMNEFWRNLIDIGNNKSEYSQVVFKEINDTALVISYDLLLPSYITQYDKKLYMNPHFFKSGTADYNVDSSRVHPIHFKYLSFYAHAVTIQLDSLEVEHLPANASHASQKFGFVIEYKNNGKQLSVTSRIYENAMELEKPDFAEYEKYFTKLRSAILDNISFNKK